MLQRVLLDQLAVDVGAIGAVQVLEERIVEDIDDQRVVAADRRVVDADVVVREAPDRVALLVHVVFGQYLAIETQNQPCHVVRLAGSAEPPQHSVKYTVPDREGIKNLGQDNRNVVLAAVVVAQLDQVLAQRCQD